MYRIILYVFLLASVNSNANGQTQTPAEMQKTTADVIQASQASIAQRLLVRLEMTDIVADEDQRKSRRSLDKANDETTLGTRNALKAKKEKAMPGGHLGASSVIEDFPDFGTMLVNVPDYPSLVLLLSNPQIKSVTAPRSMRPASAPRLDHAGRIDSIFWAEDRSTTSSLLPLVAL